MPTDDAQLRIVFTEESSPVSSSENQSVDSGSSSTSSSNTPEGQSRFYQRYPWMKAGSREAPFVQASSPYGPFEKAPDEPWAGARTNPTGKAQTPGKEEELDYWGARPGTTSSDARSEYGERERNKYQSDQEAKLAEKLAFKESLDAAEQKETKGRKPKVEEPEESTSDRFKRMFQQHGAKLVGNVVGGIAGDTMGGEAGAFIGTMAGGQAGEMLAGMGAAGAALGIAGAAAVAAGIGLYKLRESADNAVKALKGISGQVAGAEAQAQVTQLQALLRQSNQIGGELAEHVKKQGEISADMIDIQTQLLDIFSPFIEFMDNLELGLTGIAKAILKGVNAQQDAKIDTKGVMNIINVMDALNNLGNQVPPSSNPSQIHIPHGMFDPSRSHLHH